MLDPLTQGFLTAVGQKLGECAFDKTKEYLEQRQPGFQRPSPSESEIIALEIKRAMESGNYRMVKGVFVKSE
jgi:hypothetical protein